MNDLYQGLLAGLHQMTWLEGIAVFFAVLSVIFQKNNNILVYPTGIISTGVYTYLLSREHFKLYADATLNAYYLVMSVYGWIYWAKKGPTEPATPVMRSSRIELWTAIFIALAGWAIFWFLLRHYSDSNVPVMDGFVSAAACAGMWLLAKRKLENWILLNISNLVAIPLLFYKHLYLTALLTIFLFIIAIFGYLEWRETVRQREISHP
ncbi:nicotinamide mononucleotide transporter [Chitinophaga polysaccharea]|uniref:nicotinamide riboside transporter PnuC n=1 Tax=Chitinophaga TaxID=79328 RepID=UPI001455B1D2|nr:MULTISPECIES: nicotinamide riboside transporter PnuC [Chitinophaga]NLR59814.1 nicotinamide mononucleotide transporter [Chitinophaga polysaccharea]NLU96455.1 nicotinamide mononucleotide transporter [Chitinophaga sp. Ak27]